MAERHAHHAIVEEPVGPDRGSITIHVLPDDVLIGIFDFYVCQHEESEGERSTSWEKLVHVCRRWRSIVFAAPRRLGLRLLCTARTRVEMLDIWPALPIDLCANEPHPLTEDNIIAMLGHNDRICKIYLRDFHKNLFERFVAAMQVPFPALTNLSLYSTPSSSAPWAVSNSFLGGSAPGLRSLCLRSIVVPGLPKLLLSATGLIRFHLTFIPRSWDISPYVMADYLSSLTRLEKLEMLFHLVPPFEHERLHPPPLTRTILPKLNSLTFLRGRHEYLEALFTWIGAPLHDHILISFFDSAIFDVSQMSLFNGREELIQAPDRARMTFINYLFRVTLSSPKGSISDTSLELSFEWGDIAWQLSYLTYSRRPFSTPLPRPSHSSESPHWTSDMENVRWLEFLHFFAAVENLYLSEDVALCIAPALQELAAREGGAVRVLPVLTNLFIENLQPSKSGPLLETLGEFVVAREFAGHPVAVQRWEEE